MVKRADSCPLCGARLAPTQVLDACEEFADAAQCVLDCHCPYCQGHFEVMPAEGRLDLGYLQHGRFDIALSLPCEGLVALTDGSSLRIRVGERVWKFSA